MSFALFDITAKRALLTPERIALAALADGTQLSYRDLDARACRCAGLLRQLGVGPGERVAVLCRNRIEFFELLFACAKLGAVLVPLNWRMPAPELVPLLEDCRPRLLAYGSEDAAVARALAHAQWVPLALDDAGEAGYLAQRDGAEPWAGRAVWPADDTWYLLYTSGTTGVPKAVIQTFGMALVNYVNIGQAMGIRGDDVTLQFLPLFHTAGINLVAMPTLIAGGRVSVLAGFDVECVVALLARGKLDTFFGVPAVYRELSLHPDFDRLDLSAVRSWGCGGAPMPDVLIERFLAHGARVCNGMGMTETGPTAFLMDAAMVEHKIGSVGKPQLLVDVRIVGADGCDVPDGASGELWFCGPGITPGYWNRPDATAEAFAEGGWLRSGDLGRRDQDGYYYIVSRLKEMFISGGENVYPAEVENVLAEHPDIVEAAVIGVPHERWGEVGRAYLLLRSRAPVPDAAALTSFCRERLAAYKVPKTFVAVSDFPRTAAGKVRKHLLAEQARET